MSLTWSSYVATKSPKGGLKYAKRSISVKKSHFAWRYLLQSFFVWNCQRQSCKALTDLTNRAKMIGGGNPFYLKFWIKVTALEQNRRFSISFARSDSAVTPSEKDLINTNRKSTTRFLMNPRWTSYVVPKPHKGWLENAVSESWTISCDNSETLRDRMSVTTNH